MPEQDRRDRDRAGRSRKKKLIDHAQWLHDKPSCVTCKLIHQKKNEESPCETCVEPLFEENIDAVKVYFIVQNQLVVSMGQIIDLNINAVKIVMDLYEVKNQKMCLEKVMELFNYFRRESKGIGK